VEVKGLGWLGIRTAHFEETVGLFRNVMNLEIIRQELTWLGSGFPTVPRWRCGVPKTTSTASSLLDLSWGFECTMSRRPAPGWRPRAYSFSSLSSAQKALVGLIFRGPDGNVYEIICRD
jgi:hypothetical protein